jgi:hypothetical protein
VRDTKVGWEWLAKLLGPCSWLRVGTSCTSMGTKGKLSGQRSDIANIWGLRLKFGYVLEWDISLWTLLYQ